MFFKVVVVVSLVTSATALYFSYMNTRSIIGVVENQGGIVQLMTIFHGE